MLFAHARWANADQLYGFSAECGLKAVMLALGMRVDPDGVPEQEHRKHVQELWPIFRTFAQRHNGQWYLQRLTSGEPFDDWSHHDRYASTRHFSRQSTARHQNAAREICIMLQRATQDGRP